MITRKNCIKVALELQFFHPTPIHTKPIDRLLLGSVTLFMPSAITPPTAAKQSISRLAIASIVTSVPGICCFPIGLVSIGLGAIALPQTQKNADHVGAVLSICGMILGAFGLLVFLFAMAMRLGQEGSLSKNPFPDTKVAKGTLDEDKSDSQASIPSDATPPASTPELHDAKPQEITVSIQVTHEIQANNQVRIVGQSNLPPNTEFTISIQDVLTKDLWQGRAAVVTNGKVQSELFGGEKGLKDGDYDVSVTMIAPRMQPESVKKLIGEKGEKLAGPMVSAGTDLEANVKLEMRMGIGGPDSYERGLARVVADLQNYREIHDNTTKLFDRLEAVNKKRLLDNSENLVNLAEWGKFIRKLNTDLSTELSRSEKISSLQARFAVMTPLLCVENMSLDAAFRKDADYAEEKSEYKNAVREYEKFINEFEKVIEKAKHKLSKNEQPDVREWTDVSGKFRVAALLVGVVDGNATLRKSDGKEITIPMLKLSKEDQDFIRQQFP